jgi:radical SAM protein with 4Fe4S-binding SPASM domain
MIGTVQFSVYNSLLNRLPHAENPLHDLLPKDNEHGWHVSRSLKKPLNHLAFLNSKEKIACQLNLHNIYTPSERFDKNYALLEQHQARQLNTGEVVKHLMHQLKSDGKSLSEIQIRTLLVEYATIRHMEFHPSDVCNLTCTGCTYGHDDPERKPLPINYPFSAIKSVARLKPRSMVVIGGGEPTLYRSGQHRFEEMVTEVRHSNPGIYLALVTNGTYKPPGDWPHHFSWIRISLDAATEETYKIFRGKPMFDRVVRNYLDYLDYDAKYVGISFLFSRSNIHEYAEIARFVYELVQKEKPYAMHKVNIQYRPLRRDPYQSHKPFAEAITQEQINKAVTEVRKLAEVSREMKSFLRNQTNIVAVLGGNSHPPHAFSRCYYSQTFKIVRANGDLRPCFIRVAEPDFVLGNIISDTLETIALNTLFIGARRKSHCDEQGCRQCHVNYMFEQGLQGNIKPSTSPELLADPMY